MELYKEILVNCLAREEMHILFPNLKVDAKAIVEMECYKALQIIKEIIEDEELEDDECFYKIEEIVCLLEELGSDGGVRHDFG